MDLESYIRERHSREYAEKVAEYIGDDKKRFKELMNLFFVNDYRLNQRSSWAVLITIQKNPKLVKPYLPKMLKKLDEKVHDAVIRNTIRIFEVIEIPESIEGELYAKCYHYLTSLQYPVAIKAFSMTVASRIALKYPELQNEILETIDYQLPHSTAAFKSRAKRVRAAFKNQK